MGNLLIIIAIKSSQTLGTPMYFFLAYFSFIDTCYMSCVAPKVIYICCRRGKRSPLVAAFHSSLQNICSPATIILLMAMGYYCYMAICKPLCYMVIMSQRVCGLLVGVAWKGGFLHATIQILFVVQLPFCGLILLKLPCTDTKVHGLLVVAYTGAMFILFFFPCIFMYMGPVCTLRVDKSVAIYYIATPMLNPVIYTVRKMEVKYSMKKL
ncbi:olfactory receptor 4C5-like [Tachyglossus aculeatus]|uniref:olfactory receptor 4C5-like n=1 Tax=Tachyglossus aculeatus TaxID=9261 RepID=UPI0018F45149|nr:olfactory receptor 4C5-like [Tachyglossus aculeatus]